MQALGTDSLRITQVGSWELEERRLVKASAQVVHKPATGIACLQGGVSPSIKIQLQGSISNIYLLYITQKVLGFSNI